MGGGGGWGGVGMEIVFQRPRLSGVYSSWDVKVRSPYSCFLEGKERWLWILDFFFHSFKVFTAEAISLLSCMEVFKNSGSCI